MYKENVFTLAWLTLLMLFVIAVTILIGHAVSSSNSEKQKNLMECLDRGGNMQYVTNVGQVCVVDKK